MRWLNRLSPVILLGAGLFLVFMAAACQKLPPRPPVDLLDSDQDLSELERSHETWTRAPDVPNFGFGRHSIWLRLPAANPGNTRREYVLEVAAPWVDRIEFSLTGGGTTGTAGVTVPFASDSFFHRHPSFAFSLAPGESRTVYVRAVHWGLLSLPLRLWDKAEFEKKVQGEYALHGMYFGAILALLLYNLTLFFIVRDQSYLFYCIYLLALIGTYATLGGFSRQFFFPESSFVVKPGTVMTSLLALAAVSMFSRQFLKLWKINKLLDKWILTLAGTAVAGIGLAVVVPYGLSARFTNFFVPVLSVSLVVAGVLSHARGVLQSKIFLFAWLAVILGTIVEFVSKLGFAPMNVPGRYAIQMGTLVEIILFSIALGRRIRTLTLEKATTENRLNQIEKDMQLARRIQERILPLSLPDVTGAEINVLYEPLHSVGGDFYDFHVVDSRRFGVLVADVTGHGVGAALDSSTVKIAFRNEAPVMTAPSALLHGMNRFLAGTLDYRFVSAVYAFLDLDAMTITYASAGHPPILLLRGSELLSLDNEGVLLGFATDSEYAQLSTELLPGDRLLWYTDGLCDQIDPEDLPAVALHHAALKLRAEPLADFVPRLAKSMKRPKPYVQDDITLLAVGIQ